MTFGGQTSASTLDSFESAWPTRERNTRRRTPNTGDAATVSVDLMPPVQILTVESALEAIEEQRTRHPLYFGLEGDPIEFNAWLDRTELAPVLNAVARNFAQHIGSSDVRAILETEAEDPSVQRAVLIARVDVNDEAALDRLFDFTASPWWLRTLRLTSNAIVLDIQRT